MDANESKSDAPYTSPIQPVELDPDSPFQFNCHKGIACFNACCKNIDITLTPYDILRLKRRLNLSSSEWVARYTVPFEMDAHGMPGLKLATKPGTSECMFLTKEGCGVYEDRPAACRYYALGNMGVRKKGEAQVTDIYFVVKEPHCQGHFEPVTQTVAEYRQSQGIEDYDEMNRAWRDIVIKKRSSGLTVGKPSERSLQLFDLCSYDIDSFHEFIQSEGFQKVFDLEATAYAQLLADEDELYRFALRFLRQILFGEQTIPLKAHAREQRIAERKAAWEKRRDAEIERQRETLEKQLAEEG